MKKKQTFVFYGVNSANGAECKFNGANGYDEMIVKQILVSDITPVADVPVLRVRVVELGLDIGAVRLSSQGSLDLYFDIKGRNLPRKWTFQLINGADVIFSTAEHFMATIEFIKYDEKN
jgi:hypothetical protein